MAAESAPPPPHPRAGQGKPGLQPKFYHPLQNSEFSLLILFNFITKSFVTLKFKCGITGRKKIMNYFLPEYPNLGGTFSFFQTGFAVPNDDEAARLPAML